MWYPNNANVFSLTNRNLGIFFYIFYQISKILNPDTFKPKNAFDRFSLSPTNNGVKFMITTFESLYSMSLNLIALLFAFYHSRHVMILTTVLIKGESTKQN